MPRGGLCGQKAGLTVVVVVIGAGLAVALALGLGLGLGLRRPGSGTAASSFAALVIAPLSSRPLPPSGRRRRLLNTAPSDALPSTTCSAWAQARGLRETRTRGHNWSEKDTVDCCPAYTDATHAKPG